MKIGVLALQGDVIEHIEILRECGVIPVEVRAPPDLKGISGLIIPGGESTTIGKLMQRAGLDTKLIEMSRHNFPIFGTCAGAILLAKEIRESDQYKLGIMDISIRRNAYGRQLDSFVANIPIPALGIENLKAVFIRAPIIDCVGKDVRVLAAHDGNRILARQGNILVSTFHPEIAGDTRVHEYFVGMVHKNYNSCCKPS